MMPDIPAPSERGTRPEWAGFIGRLFEMAAPYLAVRGDMAHATVSHDYALTLMQQEGGDRRIVEPAVILHDVGWSALEPDDISAAYGVLAKGEEAERLNRIHEVRGAAIAQEILRSCDYDPDLVEDISAIISRHDSGKDAPSLEEGLVKDADKLWRFSRTGFWQEAERQQLKPETLLDFLDMRYRKWFFSPTALRLAQGELVRRRDEINSLPSRGDSARHH